MFNGVPDQFHQFIVSTTTTTAARTTTLPLPLSYPHLHNLSSCSSSSSDGFNSFDPLFTSNSHHHQVPTHQVVQPQFLHPLQGQKDNEEKEEDNISSLVGMNMEIQRERSMAEPFDNHHHHHHPWSNDEVLALLRIRSSMENWFPEFNWEHISRKLAELGFNRDADKCKEKFEEESRYFNIIDCSKNYRIFNELEELYHGANPHHHHQHQSQQVVVAAEKNRSVENSREDEEDNMNQNLEDEHQTFPGKNGSDHQDNEKMVENYKADLNKIITSNKKRKRQMKFEILKGLCEDIVNELMNQQEEMHNKLIKDMVKRDEEKVAREEAWKKQELDRINQELDVRAKEQAVAGDRQATIIKFLSKFSSTGSSSKKQCLRRINGDLVKVPNGYSNPPPTTTSSLVAAAQNPNPIVINQTKTLILGSFSTQNNQTKSISMAENQALQNPNPKTPTSSQNHNSFNDESNPLPPTLPMTVNKAPQNPTSNDKEDLGKRWPRDEVLALINLRGSLYNNSDHHDHKDGTAAAMKVPLWERISQGMLEIGYKRSAKRCKEKWENINKYFRKTKDVNKKRSLDSRTCPYFHQLSSLYSQGKLIAPSERPENRPALPENYSNSPETGMDSSQKGDKHGSSTSF